MNFLQIVYINIAQMSTKFLGFFYITNVLWPNFPFHFEETTSG